MTVEESRLHLESVEEPGRTVVLARGELDMATVGDLVEAVHTAAADGPVLLDLSGLEFMDSSGVRALDGFARNRPQVTIAAQLPPSVRRVLEITGVLATLPFEPDAG